jgi:apolipoprotein D and lipocalin family protein
MVGGLRRILTAAAACRHTTPMGETFSVARNAAERAAPAAPAAAAKPAAPADAGVLAPFALGTPPLEPVAEVDLTRYAGRWFQAGLVPNTFQSPDDYNVTATYTWRPQLPGLRVHNEASSGNDRLYVDGEAVRDPECRGDGERSGRLLVSFRPNETQPLVWPVGAPYWIIQLGDTDDYGYAVVSDPGRRNLWILSRTPKMERATLERVCMRLVEQGFGPARLASIVWTVQHWPDGKGPAAPAGT